MFFCLCHPHNPNIHLAQFSNVVMQWSRSTLVRAMNAPAQRYPAIPVECHNCGGRLFRVEADTGDMYCECGLPRWGPWHTRGWLGVCTHTHASMSWLQHVDMHIPCQYVHDDVLQSASQLRELDVEWCINRLFHVLPDRLLAMMFEWLGSRREHGDHSLWGAMFASLATLVVSMGKSKLEIWCQWISWLMISMLLSQFRVWWGHSIWNILYWIAYHKP